MAKGRTVTELVRLIRQMQSERRSHMEAIASIDATFDELGIEPSAGAVGRARVGRPPKKKVGRPSKKRIGRPPKKRIGRPPKKKVGRPSKKRIGRPPKKRIGRPPKKKVGRPSKVVAARTVVRRQRSRGKFTISGEASVLAFIKSNAGATTTQINDHWAAEGRKGKADNTLGKLVRENALRRTKQKTGRGSTYKAA